MKILLTMMAIIEAPTGVALLVLPTVAAGLLVGASLDMPASLTVTRVAGAALLSLAVACWLARNDERSRAAKGLVASMLLYNIGAVAVLAFAAISLRLGGVALWPAVVLHVLMAVWCLACLRESSIWETRN
jgi:hypothetical protein